MFRGREPDCESPTHVVRRGIVGRVPHADDWSMIVRPLLHSCAAMPSYRLYFLNSAGSIRQVVELPCLSDDEAISLAAGKRDGQAMELWDRDRVVKVFPAAERALVGGLATKSEQRGAGEG